MDYWEQPAKMNDNKLKFVMYFKEYFFLRRICKTEPTIYNVYA